MTGTTSTDQRDHASLKAAAWCTAVLGLVGVLTAGVLAGIGVVPSVALGAALALANLWAISQVVGAFFGGSAPQLGWGIFALLKLAAIVLLAFVLLRLRWVELLPLTLGYGALPLGIVVSQLRRPAPVVAQRD